MFIYSGNCLLCETGQDTGHKDMDGAPLFTGDIVLTFTAYEGEFLGLGFPDKLTAIVRDEYDNWAGADPTPKDEPSEFFAMGIRSVPLEDTGEWRVKKLKDHSDVQDGERWPSWGFRYAATPKETDHAE